MEEKEQIEKKIEEQKKQNNNRVINFITIGIGIFLIISLIIIKINNSSFSTLWFIIILVAIIIGFIILLFSGKIFSMFESNDSDKKITLPNPASLEALLEICDKALVNSHFANHIAKKNAQMRFIHTGKVNVNRIFIYQDRLLYGNTSVAIIINTHYPNDLRTILLDPTETQIVKAAHNLASNPEPEKDMEESTIYNPITNTVITTKKTASPKDEKKDEKEKPKDGEVE